MKKKKRIEFIENLIQGCIGVEIGTKGYLKEEKEYFTISVESRVIGHYDWECKEEMYKLFKEIEDKKYYYQHKRHGGVIEQNQKLENDENWKEITEEQYSVEYARNWEMATRFWE